MLCPPTAMDNPQVPPVTQQVGLMCPTSIKWPNAEGMKGPGSRERCWWWVWALSWLIQKPIVAHPRCISRSSPNSSFIHLIRLLTCFLSTRPAPHCVLTSLALSAPGVPSRQSVRPVWRQCGKSSWPPIAPQWASSPLHRAPPAPFRACLSSLPAGSDSGASTPSSKPSQWDLGPPSCFHPSSVDCMDSVK